jgi:hypothetical protein
VLKGAQPCLEVVCSGWPIFIFLPLAFDDPYPFRFRFCLYPYGGAAAGAYLTGHAHVFSPLSFCLILPNTNTITESTVSFQKENVYVRDVRSQIKLYRCFIADFIPKERVLSFSENPTPAEALCHDRACRA